MSEHALDTSKEEPLRTDIRLLGRLLGDTVREQEGEAIFDIIERVRQTAVRFARDGDPAARNELAALLDPLPRDTTQAVVRAFSYFLQLANIAEDEHHIRRRRAHDLAGSPPREGSLIFALDALASAAVSGSNGSGAASGAAKAVGISQLKGSLGSEGRRALSSRLGSAGGRGAPKPKTRRSSGSRARS